MGQLVGVVEKPSSSPGVVRFELNRSLSGMGHERFAAGNEIVAHTPSASLARQLIETGSVESVHIYGNMVTVDLAKGYGSEGLADVVREMYRYWKPGVTPPAFEDLAAEEPADAPASGGDDGGPELSAAAKRVPPHLLERSRAARERWKAKQG
jgi:hypothetical protein